MAEDFKDQCATEELGSGLAYCSCILRFGLDATEGKFGVELAGADVRERVIVPELGPARTAARPPPGAGGWALRFEPFDWTASRAREWAATMTGAFGSAPKTPYTGEGTTTPLTDMWTQRFCGLCLSASGFGCVRIDNACVHDWRPNTMSHFGGPVLEYFSLRRVLEMLASWNTLPATNTIEGFALDPQLRGACKRARATLGAILNGWPLTPETWRQGPSEAAQRALVASRAWSPRIVADLGGRPPWPALWNLIRFLAQRVPRFGAARECVWLAPRLTELREPIQGQPNTTELLLVRHGPTQTIGAGWWLALLLDALAPGWERPSVASAVPPVVAVRP